ncbi:3-isopropylmalate dehydratase large subunit [Rhodosalinus halophilus]|uniref:3-isopropylmalate dehydratase large subunit n=1 Tax=Rhodosalinus halophilus TaxID=2259333 RepID=A0A365U4H3_9RHOB|nr:3-isopropylmalate dehydratase large subunit [Rhodosalinus halophilus]RBI82949.1 3-isopropylmalate dehydratase large subunit [Rhodosalinus halophilus]
MSAPQTLFARLWDAHVVTSQGDEDLLWVDRHFVHEGSHHGFAKLAERGLPVAEPELTIGVADHYVPTRHRERPIGDPDIARMVRTLEENAEAHGFRLFGLNDPRQGIVHVAGPEAGLTLPGCLVVCGDSHTSTHGAFGALGFGIGATEVAHVLATQTVWQKRPRAMRLTIEGPLGPGVGAKDMALAWIAKLGADGARGHAVEYAGSAVRDLSMAGRMTLCNLSIEGGARMGMVAPDETTFAWLEGRAFAPEGAAWDAAMAWWRTLRSDEDAVFDREVTLDAAEIAPVVTWGTSPEDALPITATVPDPTREPDPARAAKIRAALDYMGLVPGRPLEGTPIDRVFIGSCTNARLEDLRAAAAILKGRRARVPGMISPGSSAVKARAEQEGLDAIFREAGLDWVDSGCSMCVGMNGDLVPPGERCASTTNRNFRGRQGPGARTHLMSPMMAAAAAVAGALTDARPLLKGRAVA